MMKSGIFNRDTATFRTPLGDSRRSRYRDVLLRRQPRRHHGHVVRGADAASKFGLDVPAINFSCLLQRSTQFSAMTSSSSASASPIRWTRCSAWATARAVGERQPAGYARHITSDPLPAGGRRRS
jgi:hypothetical protein